MREAVQNENSVQRLTVTLCGICAVCALILGGVNALTVERIAQIQAEKNAAAMAQVLPCEGGYTEEIYTGADAAIQSIHRAGEKGYVVEVNPSGSFSGTLTIMVGVYMDGAVSGVAVTKSGETSGLGEQAKRPDFREQFIGMSGEVKVTKDGGEILPLTGATITSRAVAAGVTSALQAVQTLQQEGGTAH